MITDRDCERGETDRWTDRWTDQWSEKGKPLGFFMFTFLFTYEYNISITYDTICVEFLCSKM